MKITNVTNPAWANAEHTMVNATVTHSEFGVIQFSASPDDVEAHGREIFADAVAGKFGVIAEYVAPVETPEQIIEVFKAAIQNTLDEAARANGYDDIVSACSYAGYPNVFQAEAITFGQWRANVWSYGYAELDKVMAGTRPVPTVAEILAELPALVLP